MQAIVNEKFRFLKPDSTVIEYLPGIQEVDDYILNHPFAQEYLTHIQEEVKEVEVIQSRVKAIKESK
jgi:hypothetical protein